MNSFKNVSSNKIILLCIFVCYIQCNFKFSLWNFQLQPNDQILAVNGEDVKDAPRDHVIQLVRSCENQVSLLVCQPETVPRSPGRKSTLLSPARKEKLRNKRPSRVRFAESVCVNGAPLFPVSAFSLFLLIEFKSFKGNLIEICSLLWAMNHEPRAISYTYKR